MKEEIDRRLAELVEEGLPFLRDGGDEHWVSDCQEPACHAWMASVANLLQVVSVKNSPYATESRRVLSDRQLQSGIAKSVVRMMYGLLTSARREWSGGLLREIQYIVAAETFDDFLDHASRYHKSNKKMEAGVLASAVLEDTIKKIASKNGISTAGQTLDPLTDELVKGGVFNSVKAKRVKAYAGVRNHALHAEWDEFEVEDVGQMIEGVRELIEHFL